MDGFSQSLDVLLIEDSPSDAALLGAALVEAPGPFRFAVARAGSLAGGLRALGERHFDVVLLDLNLPDSSGFATFAGFRAVAPAVPVIVLTSHGGEALALRAVTDGAQDFIDKNRLDPYWLQRSVGYAVRRFELQERLRAAETRAAAAARAGNEARAAFLARMGHEIRAPLGVLIMAAEAACGEPIDPADLREMLAVVRRNGRHLKELIDDLLDLAKVEAGRLAVERQPVATAELVAEALAILAPAFRDKGVSLAAEYHPELPALIATDPLRLRQILCNLVGNALKFTPAGGGVRVSARPLAGCGLELLVDDDGCGISADEAGRLFQPFSQARSRRAEGGTGLGLVLSRELARALGGDVELVRSAPGAGSTFRVTVASVGGPAAPHGAADAPLSPCARDAPSLAGRRLLLADDAADARLLTRRLLEAEGASVEAVADGDEALARCAEGGHDAVLLDLEMARVGGLAAARALRQRGFRGALLGLSAHSGDAARERCEAAGFDGLLSKPADQRSLADAVLDAMARHAPRDAAR